MRRVLLGLISFSFVSCGSSFNQKTSKNRVPSTSFVWQDVIEFTEMAETGYNGETFGSVYYRDIMAHSRQKNTGDSPTTNSHETNHYLNSEARQLTSANDNSFYFDQGKVALVDEPRTQARTIRNYVPEPIKQGTSRYQLYVVRQVDSYWPNILYQFDEWGAYRTGLRVAYELDVAGRLEEAVGNEICIGDGTIDFLYFASAAVASLKQNEPEYLENLQFKAAFAMLAEQSIEYFGYGAGRRIFDCHGSEFLDHFRTSDDSQFIRATIRDWMGSEWTEATFGF